MSDPTHTSRRDFLAGAAALVVVPSLPIQPAPLPAWVWDIKALVDPNHERFRYLTNEGD